MDFFLSRRGQVILISVFILFPISSSRSLGALGKFSGFALAGIVFIIFSVISIAPNLNSEYKGDTSSPLSFIKAGGISSAISTFSFAYVCQQNILLNYHSMKMASVKNFRKVILTVILVTVSLTFLVGICYISLREKSTPNILNAFPKDNIVIIVCRIFFGIDM